MRTAAPKFAEVSVLIRLILSHLVEKPDGRQSFFTDDAVILKSFGMKTNTFESRLNEFNRHWSKILNSLKKLFESVFTINKIQSLENQTYLLFCSFDKSLFLLWMY